MKDDTDPPLNHETSAEEDILRIKLELKIPDQKLPADPYEFVVELLKLFDLVSVLTFIVNTVAVYQLLGRDAAVAISIFFLIRGAGHFWGLLQCEGRVLCFVMRFIPFLGGYVKILLGFGRRWDEGFSSLGASIWVLASSVVAFVAYLLTGNFACLFYTAISLAINLFALIPTFSDFDGATVCKSITFSISRNLGLSFIFMNIFIMPAYFYWILSKQGPVDILWLSPLVISGAQKFTDEYNHIDKIKPMNSREIRNLSCLYLLIFAIFLLLPRIIDISQLPSAQQVQISFVTDICIFTSILAVVFKNNLIFWLRLKRRIFGMI